MGLSPKLQVTGISNVTSELKETELKAMGVDIMLYLHIYTQCILVSTIMLRFTWLRTVILRTIVFYIGNAHEQF